MIFCSLKFTPMLCTIHRFSRKNCFFLHPTFFIIPVPVLSLGAHNSPPANRGGTKLFLQYFRENTCKTVFLVLTKRKFRINLNPNKFCVFRNGMSRANPNGKLGGFSECQEVGNKPDSYSSFSCCCSSS